MLKNKGVSIMKQSLIDYIKRNPNDEIYTPEYAVIPLLKYIPKNKIIWECTDFGSSNITKVLIENGYKVISTHKNTFDFLIDEPSFEYDIIITNPPYSLKDSFLERCYKAKKPFCLLLPLTALEGIKRNNLYRQYGISLIVYDQRINFLDGKSNWFNASWFCYNIIPNNTLIFEKLKKENL